MGDENRLPCKISAEMCRGRGCDGRYDAERKGNGVSSGFKMGVVGKRQKPSGKVVLFSEAGGKASPIGVVHRIERL